MPKKQKFPHLVGSKWTAQQTVEGWRHFEVVNRKNQGAMVFAEIVSSCDASVRFWINAKVLKNRILWQPGWQPLHTFREEVCPTDSSSLPTSDSIQNQAKANSAALGST